MIKLLPMVVLVVMAVTFTEAGTGVTMSTNGFEMLLAGKAYNFASLTSGQTITVP